MNTENMTFGNQNDSGLPPAAPVTHISARSIGSLRDLLRRIAETTPVQQMAMLRLTAHHLAKFLNTPLDALSVDDIAHVRPGFGAYLKQKRYRLNTVRSYCNYLRILLRYARQYGWNEIGGEIKQEWERLVRADAKLRRPHLGGIIAYAIARGKRPTEFNDCELDEWTSDALTHGRSFAAIQCHRKDFFQFMTRVGLRGPKCDQLIKSVLYTVSP